MADRTTDTRPAPALGDQLEQLAQPFTGRYVQTKPGSNGASYVEHSDITQRLLHVVGPFGWELVQVLRGDVAPVTRRDGELPALHDVVVGGVWRMTVQVDGRPAVVEEVGEVEHPHNQTTDGARLKLAASDALKRCAMRLGLGLHLWCQDHYYLDRLPGRSDAPGDGEDTEERPDDG